jgi:predicted transcriptional regulator of viral defense system
VPLDADPSRAITVEDPWTLATQLFAPCYIGGWSAAEHWGLTEQIFRSVFVVSSAHVRRSRFTFLGVEFRVVKVPSKRINGTTSVWRGRERVLVSDRELTIADALIAPYWVGGFRHLAQIIRTYHEGKEWNPTRLVARMQQLGKGAGFKRLGWLLEQAFPEEEDLISICLRRRSAGLISLDPEVKAKGLINKRWGLRINVTADDR